MFIILIALLIIFTNKKDSNFSYITKKVDYVSILYKKLANENISKDFLTWIKEEYKEDALIKLNNLLETIEYNPTIWHQVTNNSYIVLQDLYNNKYDYADNARIINKSGDVTLSFVGDVSLADNWKIMPAYDERKKGVNGILSSDVLEIMRNTDIMVVNNEFTISDRGTPIPGKAFTFRGNPKRLSIYEEMGVDLVTLANNHVYDFGPIAFNDTIDSLKDYNIPFIGAGKNITEAKKPYYFILNGYKIAFVNATRAEKNILTPEASENSSGVLRCYDPTEFINLIKDTKKECDYVIALVHYGKEGYHELEREQIESSKMYIDAGADAIIGSHAHTLQGIEFYQSKPIVYNLGDFIFNNKKEDTAIFQIKLANDGNMEYFFYPALQENMYTKLLQDSEKQRVINDMNKWSINVFIDSDGRITEKKTNY